MACWACRDHYMVWFFVVSGGFDQGFWVLAGYTQLELPVLAWFIGVGIQNP